MESSNNKLDLCFKILKFDSKKSKTLSTFVYSRQ